MFVLKKKHRDRSFRPWDFRSSFMRSKSYLVNTPRSYFRAEDNEPLVNKQYPRPFFCQTNAELELDVEPEDRLWCGRFSDKRWLDDGWDKNSSLKRLRPGRSSCSFIRFYIDLPWSCLDRTHPVRIFFMAGKSGKSIVSFYLEVLN